MLYQKLTNFLGVNPNKNIINIFTDGSYAYRRKTTKLGYSFVVEYDENIAHVQHGQLTIGKGKRKLGALYAETIACLKALDYIHNKKLNHVVIYTDSLYLYKAIKDESTANNPILAGFLNKAKIKLFDMKQDNLFVDFKYIKGHDIDEGNIIADMAAKKGRTKRSIDWSKLV